MKRLLKVFGFLSIFASIAAGAYYYLLVRTRKPVVELYFEDGTMLALPSSTAEAQPFAKLAAEILAASPVST
jgi:hypothetical protein